MGLFGLWGNTPSASPGYGSTQPADAPGPARGLLGLLSRIARPWMGPRLSHDSPDLRQRMTTEKAAGQPRGVVLPNFLPWIDDTTEETPAMRKAYRLMWRDASVKAATLGKILGVAGLDLQLLPADKKNATDQRVAEFVDWNLTRRLADTVPGLIWSVLSGGCPDGYSVSEKVWGYQTRGKWSGKWALRQLKPQQVDDDLVLQTDQHKNVVGVMGLRYNGGVEMAPDDFLIYRHLPLYNSATGMSDRRAAWRPYWLLDTCWKLRALALDKRSLPILMGSYQDPSQQGTLDAALAQIKSRNWFSAPEQCKVQALDIAGRADDMFSKAIEQLQHDLFLAIQGATLQALTGGENEQRGSSKVHKSTSELLTWFLSETVLSLLNDEEHGLIRDIVDLNFVVSEYPRAKLSAVDVNELLVEAQLDKQLVDSGLEISKEEAYERYGRSPPKHKDDVMKPAQPPAPGGGIPGMAMGADDSVSVLTAPARKLNDPADDEHEDDFGEEFCDSGENKGKPGPCPDPKMVAADQHKKRKEAHHQRSEAAKKAAQGPGALARVRERVASHMAAVGAALQKAPAPVRQAAKAVHGAVTQAYEKLGETLKGAALDAATAPIESFLFNSPTVNGGEVGDSATAIATGKAQELVAWAAARAVLKVRAKLFGTGHMESFDESADPAAIADQVEGILAEFAKQLGRAPPTREVIEKQIREHLGIEEHAESGEGSAEEPFRFSEGWRRYLAG